MKVALLPAVPDSKR